MLISLRLLKKYLPIKEPATKIMESLTMGGIEVENFTDIGFISGKILVGEIKEMQPHPSSEKLSICLVDIGKQPLLKIVCGAPNTAVGQKVPVALPGAVFPDGTKIEKTVIRDVESEGMLCSGKELNYNDDHSGILILPPDWEIGEPVDCLIDIKVTPNRADCLSIIGVARDLSAMFKKKVSPPVPRFHETMDRIEQWAKVTVENKEACPRYACRLIRSVRVGPSPVWLQRAVEAGGLRSINNVVDVTNFVLLELGHPLHAFDFDKIANHHIVVRNAKEGETITTLDNQALNITPNDLLIADPAKPIALAGIMGGLHSEVDDKTINVLLEAAYFDPLTIRRTSKRLEKVTDSSYRFERGTDIKNLTLALNRSAQLIKEVASGEIIKGIIDISGKVLKPPPISINIDNANKVLGTNLTARNVADELSALGFELLRCDKSLLSLSVPSYRVDIHREVDLIEEVARIYGYQNIPTSMPYIPTSSLRLDSMSRLTRKIRTILVSLGIAETITYSFIGENQIEALEMKSDDIVKLRNPISNDQNVMRTSLIPGLFSGIKHNMNHNVLDIRIFEIGKTFRWDTERKGVIETENLVVGMCGRRYKSWNLPFGDVDFYDIKGIAEFIMNNLLISGFKIEKLNDPNGHFLHPQRSAKFTINDVELIRFGEINPVFEEKLEFKKKLYILEANVENLLNFISDEIIFTEIPKYPGADRDLAIIIDEDIPVGDIESKIREAGGKDLASLSVFDIYKGPQVPEGKKSIAFSLFFLSNDKTLTENEVNEYQQKILEALEKNFSARLR